jgi:hypothetical protein
MDLNEVFPRDVENTVARFLPFILRPKSAWKMLFSVTCLGMGHTLLMLALKPP